MNTIGIDMDDCNGCRACVRACFINVLLWDKPKKQPVVSHAEDCVHCNLCELNCPKDCITVAPDFVCIRWSAL